MVGRVVYSAAGRDRDTAMVIVGEAADHLLVCDGKMRRLERPKRKNPKHLRFTTAYLEPEKLETNRSIKRELRNYSLCDVKEEK